MDADVAQPGSIVVGARLFGEMMRKLPDGIVTVERDDNLNVNVKCGKSDFTFMGLEPRGLSGDARGGRREQQSRCRRRSCAA